MKNAIVITNVDSLLGYGLAYRFLEDWNREEAGYSEGRKTTEFRLLCHDRQGLDDLEKLGGKIFESKSFVDESFVQRVMEDVYYVMFVPENSKNRIAEGQAIIHGAKHQKVDYMAMFSYTGVNQLESSNFGGQLKNLKEFFSLEIQVAENFGRDNYCIVQSAIWDQFFYFLGPKIEDDNKICLPIEKDREWGSVDLADFLDGVYNISSEDYDKKNEQSFHNLAEQYVSVLRKKNKRLFQFTASHKVTASKVVKAASHGLHKPDMTYEKIKADKLINYLRNLQDDNRFRERPIQQVIDSSFMNIDSDEDLARDRPYTFPLGKYLNDDFIQTLIELWELIDSSKAVIITDELEKALHRKPLNIEDFFKRNRDQFRRLR